MNILKRSLSLSGMLIFVLLVANTAAAQSAPKCEVLAQSKVGADRIGLSTRGATITQSKLVTPPATAGSAARPYCMVSGIIAPADPTAPDIRFQVGLPVDWNGKALMLGGGGLDGVVPAVAEPFALGLPTAKPAIALGYAVFASDGGQPAPDGAALGNAEAYRNYLGEAVKKTHDVAIEVIKAAYGRPPSKSYFRGGSKGGGEAMAAVTRWPKDWDGAVAWYPMRDVVVYSLGMLRTSQVLAGRDAFLDLSKRGVLYRAALETCDGLDGLRDGLISDEKGCRAKFDLSTARLDGAPIRCVGGRDTGDTCLSDTQITALKTIESPMALSFLPGAPRTFPGFNMLTADLGASEASPTAPRVAAVSMGMHAATFPITPGTAAIAGLNDTFFRVVVTKDKAFNYLGVDPVSPGPLTVRLRELARLDQADRDLTPFAKRGGKLILIQGTGDMLVSARATENYYQSLRARMGPALADRSLRFYEVPGFGHGASTVFDARVDDLAILEAWAERGQDPAQNEVVTDAAHGGRTRPLCQYPNWPRYKGAGDPNAAASFICTKG